MRWSVVPLALAAAAALMPSCAPDQVGASTPPTRLGWGRAWLPGASLASSGSVRGVWTGEMQCSSGPVDLAVILTGGAQGASGFAEFHPRNDNGRIASGVGQLRVVPGTRRTGGLNMQPVHWYRRPTPSPTGLAGDVQPDGSFSGRVLGQLSCSTFSMRRALSAEGAARSNRVEQDPQGYVADTVAAMARRDAERNRAYAAATPGRPGGGGMNGADAAAGLLLLGILGSLESGADDDDDD